MSELIIIAMIVVVGIIWVITIMWLLQSSLDASPGTRYIASEMKNLYLSQMAFGISSWVITILVAIELLTLPGIALVLMGMFLYFILGFVLTLVAWRVKGRKLVRNALQKNGPNLAGAIAIMERDDRLYLILSSICIWPFRILNVWRKSMHQTYVGFRDGDIKDSALLKLFDKYGITEADRVEYKLKQD